MFCHVYTSPGRRQTFLVLTVCKDSIVTVLVGNGTVINGFRTSVTDIRSFIETVAPFFDEIRASLVTGRAGSTFNVADYIILSTESYQYRFGTTTRVQIGPYADGGNTCYLSVNKGYANINAVKLGVKTWTWVSGGTIPTDCGVVIVTGHTGSDNPCNLGAGSNGQVIHVLNTNKKHRVNIKNCYAGDYWIVDGHCATFVYVTGYGWFSPVD